MKRLVKLVISLCFLALSKAQIARDYLIGRKRRASCIVFYYHAVRPGHRELFARQLEMLLAYATPIRLDTAEQLESGGRYAAVTFDDGFRSFAENALPELTKRAIPSTMFVVSGAMGEPPAWLTESYLGNQTEIAMSAEELRELPRECVTIGSHTVTHPQMTKLAAKAAKDELVNSRNQLENALGRTIKLFSFPYGLYDPNLVEWCREAGYERVFTVEPSFAFSATDQYVVGRVSVDPIDWPVEFWLKLRGAYNWETRASSMKRKLNSVWSRLSGSPEAVKEPIES